MFGFRKKIPELDELIQSIEMNMENNYKDCAQSNFHELKDKMCDLLYPANINIDYFPANFVVYDDEIFYIDYECNDYMEEWNFENWGIKYWSKTPEFLRYAEEHGDL